jgi:predicted esterase
VPCIRKRLATRNTAGDVKFTSTTLIGRPIAAQQSHRARDAPPNSRRACDGGCTETKVAAPPEENEHGVAAFVLYRTVPTPLETPPFLAVLDGITPPYGQRPPVISREQALTEERATMADGVAAVAYVRERAADFAIDANRIGMIGFSAGAYTTLNVALSADPAGRPDFIGVLYGSLPSGASTSASAPPAFIAAAVDDPQVPIAEDIRTFMSWSRAGAPAELHLFRSGSHGFGVRDQGTGSDQWRDVFIGWLGEQGFLTK